MKNTLIHLFIFLFFASGSIAQTPQYHWMNQLGGTGFENGGYIAVDHEGFVYTISSMKTDIFFKPFTPKEYKVTKTTAASIDDLVLTKVDAAGNLVWLKQIPGPIGGTSIAADSDNNLIIVGSYKSTVDFDPGPGVYNQTAKDLNDIFILKLDKNGDFIWAGSIGGKNNDRATSVIVDQNDNIALVCLISDTVDFDMSTTVVYNLIATSPFEEAVLKISSSGKFLWAYHTKRHSADSNSF